MEEEKIFHGAPSIQGVGGLSFGLYRDKRYQIISSGGIGVSYYSGSFTMTGDTIILRDLDKKSGFVSNRLLIVRYKEQDSTFWKWKYPNLKGLWELQNAKYFDSTWASGDVYQLSTDNIPIKDQYYFYIRLDSLKIYR